MFTKPISENDFISAMIGIEGAPLEISASHFANGKTVRLFAARYEPAHHAVAPFSRPQLVKSIEYLLHIPEAGKVSIYDIGQGRAMYLNDLAHGFPSLTVYVARSGKKAFAIVKADDRKDADAENFQRQYDGNDKLPTGTS